MTTPEQDPMIEIGKIKLPPTFGQMADGKPFGHDDRDSTIAQLREALSLANARNAELEAAIQFKINIITEYDKGSTHYEGCEKHHRRCAAVKRMSSTLKIPTQ